MSYTFPMVQLNAGQTITVYDEEQRELGEGTYRITEIHSDMNLTAYICEEHTILAKGKHFLRIGLSSELHLVPA